MFEPAVLELDMVKFLPNLQNAFRNFCTLDHVIFLDGQSPNASNESLQRYSFIAADPIEVISVSSIDPFNLQTLRDFFAKYQSKQIDGLPSFQGGLAGLIGYEFNAKLEKVPRAHFDEFESPVLCLGVYDVIVAFDHHQNRAWIVSQGWPETDEQARKSRAQSRLEFFADLIESESDNNQTHETPIQIIRTDQLLAKPLESYSNLELFSDFTEQEFLDSVSKAVDYIHRGDVFQINLSQRLLTPATRSSCDLFLELRSINPAPFSSYFDFGNGQVVSSSPERLVSMQNGKIETRPIKGTRKRTRFPEVDLNTQIELLSSEKDRAENTMIVDLMRNDLSRVSQSDSVVVKKLCGIEEFQNVMHLVSVVQSKIADGCDAIDLLASVFPGGSITGAPKIRAMEIISELEPTARGPYCGSLGYINFDGTMDFNILIRTITAKDGWWQVPVGGGIVADSDPQKEYDETWAKAVGMLNAIRHLNDSRSTNASTVRSGK